MSMDSKHWEYMSSESLFGDVLLPPTRNFDEAAAQDYSSAGTFAVDLIQCYRFAALVPRILAERQAGDPFSLHHLSQLEQITALGHLVGICDRLNWDFTLGPLATSLWSMTEGFVPAKVESLSTQDFQRAFGSYKRSDGRVQYAARLRRLRDIARHFARHKIPERLRSSSTALGDHGALSLLRESPVFSDDPVHKKCNALLHELVRRRLVTLSDSAAIPPAVDYHILRLYLRTGRVLVTDQQIYERLIARTPMRIELLTELRKATADAVMRTAWFAAVSISVLNDAEWAFARQACRRDAVWCATDRCLVGALCPSARLNPAEMLTEPRSMHGHY